MTKIVPDPAVPLGRGSPEEGIDNIYHTEFTRFRTVLYRSIVHDAVFSGGKPLPGRPVRVRWIHCTSEDKTSSKIKMNNILEPRNKKASGHAGGAEGGRV